MTLIRGLGGTDVRRRGIGTVQLSVGALFNGSFTPFTTTDLVTLWSMGFVDFWLPDKASHLIVPTSFQVAHSVAGGRFFFGVILFNVDDDGNQTDGVQIYRRNYVAIPLANEWMDFSPTPIGLMSSRTPGRHRCYWVIQNLTAGTLYVGLNGESNGASGYLLGTVDS